MPTTQGEPPTCYSHARTRNKRSSISRRGSSILRNAALSPVSFQASVPGTRRFFHIQRPALGMAAAATDKRPGIPIRGAPPANTAQAQASDGLQYMSHYCMQARQRNEELAKQLESVLLEKQTMEGMMSKYFADMRSEQCLRMQLQMQMAASQQLHGLPSNKSQVEELEAQLQSKEKLVQSLTEQVSQLRAKAMEDTKKHEAVERELATLQELNDKLQRDLAASSSKTVKQCSHCRKMGHTADSCWDLHPGMKSYCNQCKRSGHPTHKCHFLPDDPPVRNQRRRLNY